MNKNIEIRMVQRVVQQALKEDQGAGDITTRLLVPEALQVKAVIVARESMVVCGLECVRQALVSLDRNMHLHFAVDEGAVVKAGTVLIQMKGNARAILTAERVALNFLGKLSGVASVTRSFVEAVRGTKAVILDTRKTTPGMRVLERHAVRTGGGANHRFDLSQMVLVKDNHRFLSAGQGSLAGIVSRLRRKTKKTIEVEVDTLAELAEVLIDPPEMILLDNMPAEILRKAVKMAGRLSQDQRPLLEASGGISIKNVRAVAMTGVDRISIGALTHSARCRDVSLEIRKVCDV